MSEEENRPAGAAVLRALLGVPEALIGLLTLPALVVAHPVPGLAIAAALLLIVGFCLACDPGDEADDDERAARVDSARDGDDPRQRP